MLGVGETGASEAGGDVATVAVGVGEVTDEGIGEGIVGDTEG